MRVLYILLYYIFSIFVYSQNPTVYAEDITAKELKSMLTVYASDAFQGREAGTEGEQIAVKYLRNKYQKLGSARSHSTEERHCSASNAAIDFANVLASMAKSHNSPIPPWSDRLVVLGRSSTNASSDGGPSSGMAKRSLSEVHVVWTSPNCLEQVSYVRSGLSDTREHPLHIK